MDISLFRDTRVRPFMRLLALLVVIAATPFLFSFALYSSAGSAGSFSFGSATYSVGENGGSIVITIDRLNGSSGTASVTYATSNDTAIAGTDYVSKTGTLKFLPSQTRKTFTVDILDDAVTEGNETVTLTLSNPSKATLGSPSQAVLTIVDNESSATVRPNVVLVLTDDQTVDDLQYMPATNALIAASGSTFTNGYATTSLCCPSRSSILTGQYVHNHGVHGNTPATGGGFTLFDDSSTLPVWLKNAGYKTALVGKYLNGYELAGTYTPPGWSEWHAFGSFQTAYYYYNYTMVDNGVTTSYGSTAADYGTDVISQKANSFIAGTQTNDQQPFFLYFAPVAPHDPATPAPRHANAFTDLPPLRPPSFNEADVSDKPAWVQSLPLLSTTDIAGIDQLHVNRVRSLQALDEAVSSMVGTLQKWGELDRTIFIFASDNGFHQGEHRKRRGKNDSYEESIKVPFIVHNFRQPLEQVSSALVLNIDLAPTILNYIGIPIPPSVDGRSLAPLIQGNQPLDWRQDFLVEHWFQEASVPYKAPEHQGVHDANSLYVEYPGTGEREFYDLLADPYQLTNSVNDPLLAERIAAMQARLNILRTCAGLSCR